MTPIDIAVISSGLVTIILIAWYFFGPKGQATIAQETAGHQEVTIVVDGAYSPPQISLKAGIPTKIIFDRRDKGDCTEWVIFESVPTAEGNEIKTRLPEGKKTTVSFTPSKSGTYGFVCGMGMVHGKLIVTN